MRLRIALWLERIGRWLGWGGVAIVALLPFAIAYDAVARSFGHPTIWIFETSLFGFIAAGFLANAVALKEGAHFRITFLGLALPRLRPFLDAFALLMVLIFALVLLYASARFVGYSWSNDIRSNSLLSAPLWLPQLALPVGALALALQTLAQMLRGVMPSNEDQAEVAQVILRRAG